MTVPEFWQKYVSAFPEMDTVLYKEAFFAGAHTSCLIFTEEEFHNLPLATKRKLIRYFLSLSCKLNWSIEQQAYVSK